MFDYTLLQQSPRLLLQANLRPVQGDRFQPTGFADIGAAEYSRPDRNTQHGTRMLLVESAQSIANRLEKTCLHGDGPDIEPSLAGLPYVTAILSGGIPEPIRVSSLLEPHRLASPFFLKANLGEKTFGETLSGEMGYSAKGPLNWRKIYAALFKYDPNCLVHGVFLSLLGDGRVRVPRAVTGFIEAENVKQVVSGGVKNSAVDPKGEIQVEGADVDKGVYSNVPYARVEYVAESITAFFNLDATLVRSYGLGEPATRLLLATALLKIRRFLSTDLRLRTACNLEVIGEVECTAPEHFTLPAAEELLEDVKNLIPVCKAQFAEPAVTELAAPVKIAAPAKTGKKKARAGDTSAAEDQVPEGTET